VKRGDALLYPDRQRCMICQKYFSGLVVKGLYDSYECAGMEVPSPNWRERPRCCVNPARRSLKVALLSEEEAVKKLRTQREKRPASVYECGYCGMWHIGHGLREEQKEGQ
jgi:hypothetical protein